MEPSGLGTVCPEAKNQLDRGDLINFSIVGGAMRV